MTGGDSVSRWGVFASPELFARLQSLRTDYPDLSYVFEAAEKAESLSDSPFARVLGPWVANAHPASNSRCELSPAPPFVLQMQDGQLTLMATQEPRWAGIAVDFLAGGMAHRRRQPVGGEMVVKAVWGRSKEPFTVLDATAGLGRDGFLLASSGATVVSCERHPAIALLLADGHWRARQAGELDDVLARWTLQHADAITLMTRQSPEVIYLDPMFPEREKTALVKKEMRAFRELVGEDLDAQALFDAACQYARKRVVVKRPASGESLGRKPSHVLEGKSNRFDVYVVG